MAASDHLQPQQFYHGTDAELQPGDMITSPSSRRVAGRHATRRGDFSFFTTDALNARTYAPRTFGYDDAPGRTKYVYTVEPTGSYNRDTKHYGAPNYKSRHPLRVTGVYDKTSVEAQMTEHNMHMDPVARQLEAFNQHRQAEPPLSDADRAKLRAQLKSKR